MAFIVSVMAEPYFLAVRRYDPHITKEELLPEIVHALNHTWGWVSMYAKGRYMDGPGWKELHPE